MSMDPMIWLEVCPLTAIPQRGARVVKTTAGCIALFRTIDDEVFALDDECPHKKGPLSQGIVHGKSVTCPLHNWVISFESGEAQGADQGQARTRTVRIVEGMVQLALPQLSVAAE